jgi:PAS domain S-box-containing protein
LTLQPEFAADPAATKRLIRLSRVAATICMVVGGVVLIGWTLDIDLLKSWSPNLIYTKTNMAVSLMLAGVALWTLREGPRSRVQSYCGYFCVSIVLLNGALALSETLFHWNLGIDQFLFAEFRRSPGTLYPNRMGLTGAICLVFAGCSLLLMDVRRGFYPRLGQLLDLLVAVISFSALWGFLFRYRPLYAFSSDIWIALPAAIGLFVLSVGMLLARPSRGWMRIFSAEAPGSMLLRRLVPASIIIPVVWARFWLYGQRAGLYGTEVGEILFATTMTVGLILVLYFTVKPLNQADAQRKGAEAEIRELNAEAKYRGLLEAAPDAMVVVNQGGEIVLLNLQAEKQFGYRRDELVGQKVKNIIPEGFAERLITDGTRTAAEALAQQIGTGIELTGRRKDGSEFPIEIMLSPLEGTEGILVTAAIRDITDHKRAEEELARQAKELVRSNADLQQFAYVASHDLQEPLRMVASYTQLLAQRYKGRLDSDADEFIAYAVDGAHRMQRLIGDLLAYCRVGTVGMELRKTSSGAALEQALLNLQDAIEKSVGVVTHDALPTVVADGAQLVQLFQNVVGNAIKYRSAELPHVHVSAKKNGGHEWIFSLRDNGLGIDPKYFEKIFVMFQRLHDREESSGTGIGLTVCKKIAERHGGRMWVESEPGKGSTFYFALPERG